MKNSKMIFFMALILLMLSVNFAFAADENSTQIISEDADENVLEVEEVTDTLNSNPEDVVAEESGYVDYPQTVKMNGVTKRYYGAIEYKATFYDVDGTPLKNAQVLYEVDDSRQYYANTDSNGVALLTVFLSNGNHKILAVNTETLDYDSVNVNVFKLITGNKNIKMYYDDGNTMKVRIFGDDGKPVKAGQKVNFFIGKNTCTKKTDKNGYAKLKISVKPGLYETAIKYKDYVVTNDLTVKQVLKQLTSFSAKKIKSSIKFKVKYLGKNKKNKVLKVKFNKKTYKAKTNKKGIAVFKLKTPKKAGSYQIVTSYKKVKISSTYYRT